jgi:hypothetical protein
MTQPDPGKGVDTVPRLVLENLDWMHESGIFDEDHVQDLNAVLSGLRSAIGDRDLLGIKKYGTSLETHNGRDPNVDAQEELLDAFQYITQAFAENRLDKETINLLTLLYDYASNLYNLKALL